MEKQNSENLTTIWLSLDIIRTLKIQAAMVDLTAREYMDQLAAQWIEHRKAEEGNLDPMFGYTYVRPPSRKDDDKSRKYTINMSPGAASVVRKYAFDDGTSLSSIIYTILHYSLKEDRK